MKSELAALITAALEKLVVDGALNATPDVAPQIDRPRDPSHGDLSCNIAMVLAKRAGMAPRELAAQLIAALPDNNIVERCDIAGPGLNQIPYMGPGTIVEIRIETIVEM